MGEHTSRVGTAAWTPTLGLLFLPVAFAFLSIATYRPSADGEFRWFALVVAFAAGAGPAAFGAVRLATLSSRLSWTAWIALVLAVSTVAVPHVVRVLHPARRGAPFIRVVDAFSGGQLDEVKWELTADEGASLEVDRGVRLSVPTGARAALELKPAPPEWWVKPPAAWVLPIPFDDRSFGEQLEWRASARRDRTFFVMVETQALLVQLAPYGLHVTLRAAGTTASELAAPTLLDGAEHSWGVHWSSGVTSLWIDGRTVWERGDTPALGRIRLGETRTDELHGGELRLSRVSYRRWWEPVPRRT